MAQPQYSQNPPPGPPRRQPPSDKLDINAGRLWGGGVAAAVIGAVVALVALWAATGVFDVTVAVPDSPGSDVYKELGAGPTLLVGFAAGIIATAVLHGLLLVAPRPLLFFQWLSLVVIAAAAIYPFTLNAPIPDERASEIALAVIHVVTGVAIVSLLSGIVPRVTRLASQGGY